LKKVKQHIFTGEPITFVQLFILDKQIMYAVDKREQKRKKHRAWEADRNSREHHALMLKNEAAKEARALR
jgi:hypothetical protein